MFSKEIMTGIGRLEAYGYENGQYPVTVQQFQSVGEALSQIGKCSEDEVVIEAPEGALTSVLAIINGAQDQGGKQGGKETIRAAMSRELGEGEERQAVVEGAVKAHQKRAAQYIIGAPRGAQGGVTKTRSANIGRALLEKLGGAELEKLAAEAGLDLTEL